jgi:hypothetical protein
MTTTQRIDDEYCERLILRACDGDEEVWKDLTLHLWPHFQALVRSSRAMGNMAKSEDHVHNVLTNLVDKLGTDGGRAITQFPRWKEQNPGKTFSDWIRIVTSYTVNDYVRAALGRRKQATSGEDAVPSIKRLLDQRGTLRLESSGLHGSADSATTAHLRRNHAGSRADEGALSVARRRLLRGDGSRVRRRRIEEARARGDRGASQEVRRVSRRVRASAVARS